MEPSQSTPSFNTIGYIPYGNEQPGPSRLSFEDSQSLRAQRTYDTRELGEFDTMIIDQPEKKLIPRPIPQHHQKYLIQLLAQQSQLIPL